LNSLSVYSLLSPEYGQFFGLSEVEVKEVLGFEGMIDRFADVKAFYNGYFMVGSDKSLYNPWSILNCLVRKAIEPYWVLAGGTDKLDKYIMDSLWRCGEETHASFLALLENNETTVPFVEDVTYEELGDSDALWSVLYSSGYVTGRLASNRDNITVRSPNTEVTQELARLWRKYFKVGSVGPIYKLVLKALFEGDATNFGNQLRKLALEVFRYALTAFATLIPSFFNLPHVVHTMWLRSQNCGITHSSLP
jgi:hypothetical protein